MLTQSRVPRSSGERSWSDEVDKHPSARTPPNDRAIELSEKGHVELVLYARGLELERDRLLQLARSVQERLAALTRTTEVSPQVREAIHDIEKILAKCL